MAISGFRHIPCGTPVNASEQLAIEKLRTKLQSTAGPWILLSNLSHSPGAGRLSDEIDQVVIGPSGVFVIEVNDNPNLDHGWEDSGEKDEVWVRLTQWFLERLDRPGR